jgi:SWI/SNF-related matrix-associated actin-dependent regulator 1 of chromatin subfamily A
MRLDLVGDRFVITCKLSEVDVAREAGFGFDSLGIRKWYTTDWKKAASLIDYGSEDCRRVLQYKIDEHEAALNASHAMFADADIPVPDLYHPVTKARLDYLPYQKAGIVYCEPRKQTLIGDSPGLGKTIQAIGVINNHDIQSGLIICPASLKLNWFREMNKWLYNKSITVGVAYGSDIPTTDFVIANYDILKRNEKQLRREQWGLVAPDEAQYLANPEAGRTEIVLGEWVWDYRKKRHVPKVKPLNAWKWAFLTGTPMSKRPKDMWGIIRHCDPEGLGKDWMDFAYRYCDASEGMFGLEANGGSNLEELNERLRKTFMVRRIKAHVLKDLPPKTRQVIVLPPEGLKKLIKSERDKFTDALAMLNAVNEGKEYDTGDVAMEDLDPGFVLDTMTRVLKDFDREGLADLTVGEVEPGFAAYSEARRELALSKVPMAVEQIKRLVEADEKVIVFAIHKDVIARLREAFPPEMSARIIGGMTTKKVESEKLRFQGSLDDGIPPDPECRLMFANLKAGGTGHTLTEATCVVFVEMWGVPSDMEQCEDRAHRFGQDKNVLVQYLVVDGTMDAHTIQTLIQRIEIIEKAVD